jgi:UDPglucose--hexose-1-phosphate uridylyltransferase
MKRLVLHKTPTCQPDGRSLIYYDFMAAGEAPPQRGGNVVPREPLNNIERRWNPLLGEWGLVGASRMGRPLLPSRSDCPLCPGVLEIPEPYDLAVFENRFPALSILPDAPRPSGQPFYESAPAYGACEVVMYTSKHDTSLAQMSVDDVYRLLYVWADRFREISSRPEIECVFIFENKGEEVGVTLHHPHSQIYAFPFIPPRLQSEVNQMQAHQERGECLFCSIIDAEKKDGRRIIAETADFTAFVPYFARWSFEVQIHARHDLATMNDFNDDTFSQLAQLLKLVISKYDNLFNSSFPYMMIMHQLPLPGWHFHIEFYPPYRDKGKMKYVAGVESGCGNFIIDCYPEDRAAQLQQTAPNKMDKVGVEICWDK